MRTIEPLCLDGSRSLSPAGIMRSNYTSIAGATVVFRYRQRTDRRSALFNRRRYVRVNAPVGHFRRRQRHYTSARRIYDVSGS